jgi:lactate permease
MAGLGWCFPFFLPFADSDTSSDVLFNNQQKVSAEQLGLSPLLACAANSSGGVKGRRPGNSPPPR